MTPDPKAKEALILARIRAKMAWPYFGHALMALQPIEEPKVAEMGGLGFGVDRYWRLYYDPKAVAAMSVEDSAIGLRHEIIHLLRKHHQRAGNFPGANHKLVNICQDAEINDDIAEDCKHNASVAIFKNMKLLDSDMTPTKLNEIFGTQLQDGRLWEEYYQAILDKCPQPQQPQQGGAGQMMIKGPKGQQQAKCCGSGATGEPMPYDLPPEGGKGADGQPSPDAQQGLTSAEVAMVIQSTAKEIQAHVKAKGIGSVPSDLVRWAEEELGEPQIDWREQTMSLIASAAEYVKGMVDYTYSKPSRRASAFPEVCMPGMQQPVPEIVLIQDTSGSMSQDDIRAGVTEVEGLCQALGCEVTVIDWDAGGHSKPQKVSSAYTLQLAGGGGTDMAAAIIHASKMEPRPDMIICHTDGDTPWPQADTYVPTIAVIVGSQPGNRKGCPEWITCCWIEPQASKGKAA